MLDITFTGGLEALIFEDEGLGTFMEALECEAVPSNEREVHHGEAYFGGAGVDKIISKHGSRNGGQV